MKQGDFNFSLVNFSEDSFHDYLNTLRETKKKKISIINVGRCIFWLFCKKGFWFTDNLAIDLKTCKKQISLKLFCAIINDNATCTVFMILEWLIILLNFRKALRLDSVLTFFFGLHRVHFWWTTILQQK